MLTHALQDTPRWYTWLYARRRPLVMAAYAGVAVVGYPERLGLAEFISSISRAAVKIERLVSARQ